MSNLPARQSPIVPIDADPQTRSKLARFEAWLAENRRTWWQVDLDAYRDHLLISGLKRVTVSYYVSAVRMRYAELIQDRALLYGLAPAEADPVARKAYVDEMATRLQHATHKRRGRVKLTRRRDVGDADGYRLTRAQADELLNEIDIFDPLGARDAAVFALMFGTGIRIAEAATVRVSDLWQSFGGALALRVRHGKGDVQRFVPYGSLGDHFLPYVEHWMKVQKIRRGSLWGESLTTRALALRFERYPIDGRCLKPHDPRRTYARWLYEMGVPSEAIAANLGHKDVRVTWRYIGNVREGDRIPNG